MTDKELRRLSREELLRLLMEADKENRKLRNRLNKRTGQPDDQYDADIEYIEAKTAAAKKRAGGKLPDSGQLREELKRTKYRRRYRSVLRSTVGTLITVAAISVLVATLWTPVLRIYGSSMTPTLTDGEIVVSIKTSDFESGEIVSFYFNNKILIKRVICGPGDWIDIDDQGNVYVNGTALDEPYLTEKALGECNIKFPYQVPDGKIFVMGDHRSTSVDSRNTAVGCVAQEQIVGKILFRVWPLNRLGMMD